MGPRDRLRFVLASLRDQPLRTGLTALGIAIGIAAVVLLTAIGRGIQAYVVSEFTQFGTNLIAVVPGKQATLGISPGVFGSTRPLTLEDAEALRRLPYVQAVVPVIQGNARVESGARSRRTEVLGVGPEAPQAWRFGVAAGRFLPADDARAARSFAVLGAGLREELFGAANPLGRTLRIAQHRFRVVGVMERKGQILGFDIDNAIYVPAARALELFDREGLMEVDLLYSSGVAAARVEAAVKRLLAERHGREDVSTVSQDQMLEVLGGILDLLTGAVAALGAISLLVGAVGILTIMTIAVTERTPEIGLLRALGSPRRQILGLFLVEATVVAALGGVAGLGAGAALAHLLHLLVPALPVQVSAGYAALALAVATGIGLAAGVLPARHAARIDPIEALRAE